MEVSTDTTISASTGVSHIPHQSLTASPNEDPKQQSLGAGDGGRVPDPGPGIEPRASGHSSHANDAKSSTEMTASSPGACPSGFATKADSAVRVEIPVWNGHHADYSALSTIPNPNTGMAKSVNLDGGDVSQQSDAAPPAKKRKLSPASREAREQEKLLKQQEKEAKERQKAEEKARRDEERRAKEQEKQRRDAEREEERRVKEDEKKKRDAEREEERKRREEKKRVKDEEKAARDEEKRKKEEEKSKKERAQTKLNCFFAKPKLPEQSPKKPVGSQIDAINDAPALSDYQLHFPDFFLQTHTKLAPMHRFQRDPEALRNIRTKVDNCLKSADGNTQVPLAFRPSELFRIMPYKRRRGRQAASVKDILLKIQNRGGPLDANGASETSVKLQDTLRKIPMKSLKFGEDVRPPYQGTYSKPLRETSANKISRNPFHRGLPETNYDYDSEAEWEDPGEGEDLDSEEEEDVSEEGDDDMEGFLDDEDDQPVDGKRRLIVGDLEPVCTGIRWQEDGVDRELQMYQAATISASVTFPIDPFSTAYWKSKGGDSVLSRPETHHTLSTNPGASTQAGPDRLPGKAKRPFPPEHLAQFKQVVNGSDLSKTGVVEVLKKRFPKVSKEVLKGTLDSVAERVGQKEADKKWVCR